MNKFSIGFFLFTLVALISCEKEIPYEGNDTAPLLVVNAVLENDSLISVYLERSVFFLTQVDEVKITSGATIRLTNKSTGEVFVVNTPTFENRYDFTVSAFAGVTYEIQVSHADYPTASSTMQTATKIGLTAVDTSSYTLDNRLYKSAHLKWNDPSDKNYYFVRVYNYDANQNSSYPTYFSTQDEVFSRGNTSLGKDENTYEEIYFTDELFAGSSKDLEIHFETYKGSGTGNNPVYKYELISMNEACYKYHVSVEKAKGSGGFFSEPVKIYNNIEDGFGIFCSYGRSVISK